MKTGLHIEWTYRDDDRVFPINITADVDYSIEGPPGDYEVTRGAIGMPSIVTWVGSVGVPGDVSEPDAIKSLKRLVVNDINSRWDEFSRLCIEDFERRIAPA